MAPVLALTHRTAITGADAITRGASTGHIFDVARDPGTITVIDPATDAAVVTIAAGEKMKYAASDDRMALVSPARRRAT